MLGDVEPPRGRWRAWTDDGSAADADDTLDALIAGANTQRAAEAGHLAEDHDPHERHDRDAEGRAAVAAAVARADRRAAQQGPVPRAAKSTELCVPMFHALGFMQAIVGVALGSTLVVRRRFDPEATLESLERHGRRAMVVVPVMLRRMLDLGEEAIEQRDHSALRIIFVSGSALGTELARRAREAFGPVVYNLYGSTEVAYATIATPEDLEAEPRPSARSCRGSVVKILDEHGKEVPAGESGRIFVGNLSQFEGYTGGGEQGGGRRSDVLGDVGHFDERGPAVHRRPRRRDDRLRRRERVPGRGRGAARRPRRDPGGGRDRRRGRRSSVSG